MTSNLLSSSALDEETARAEIYGLLAQLFYQVPAPELLAACPATAAWLARCLDRPAQLQVRAMSRKG